MRPRRVPIRIPIRALGHVNAYLIGDVLVDPGMASGVSVASLARWAARESLGGVQWIALTHFHVDHATLAPLIAALTGAEILAGRGDLEFMKGGVEEFIEETLRIYADSGTPHSVIEAIRRSHPALRLSEAYRALADLNPRPLGTGDLLRVAGGAVEVVEAPGHTPGSIILRGGEWLVTGDALLERITPHVTLHSWDSDPLGDYMSTLRAISAMGAVEAYPGHGDPFPGPARRALEILRHHEARLAEAEKIVCTRGPLTGFEAASMMKWRSGASWSEMSPMDYFFAVGEALAHLRRLEVEGRVERVEANGLTLWKCP